MITRASIPRYAREQSVALTKEQLHTIMPGRAKHPVFSSGSEAVCVALTRDGKAWSEWRGSAVFWACRWYEVPRPVYERAKLIDNFVQQVAP